MTSRLIDRLVMYHAMSFMCVLAFMISVTQWMSMRATMARLECCQWKDSGAAHASGIPEPKGAVTRHLSAMIVGNTQGESLDVQDTLRTLNARSVTGRRDGHFEAFGDGAAWTGHAWRKEETEQAAHPRIDAPSQSAPVLSDEHGTAGIKSGHHLQTLSGAPALLRPLIVSSAHLCGLEPALLASVAATESGFDPNAVSKAGARGLLQLMPPVARHMGILSAVSDRRSDPWASLLAGGCWLRTLIDQQGLEKGLATYHGGPNFGRESERYAEKVIAGARQ